LKKHSCSFEEGKKEEKRRGGIEEAKKHRKGIQLDIVLRKGERREGEREKGRKGES